MLRAVLEKLRVTACTLRVSTRWNMLTGGVLVNALKSSEMWKANERATKV